MKKAARVVSLIASSTEIIAALGAEARLVGRSHECDYPTSVLSLPVCSSPKFQLDGTSYDIDQRIKALVQEALAVYRVDGEVLKKLHPDLIVTQTQCEVCAVSERDVDEALAEYLGDKPTVLSLSPNNLQDIWQNILQVADALSVPEQGAQLVSELRARIDEITDCAAQIDEQPTVCCIEWLDPLMAAGNWVPELVQRAGGVNLFGEAGKHSPWMSWEEVAARDPDVIVILPCGFDIKRSEQELRRLQRSDDWLRRWQSLRAVQTERVYILDGNQFFNRPGPRMVESLEILAEVLHQGTSHAEAFPFGHAGADWRLCKS